MLSGFCRWSYVSSEDELKRREVGSLLKASEVRDAMTWPSRPGPRGTTGLRGKTVKLVSLCKWLLEISCEKARSRIMLLKYIRSNDPGALKMQWLMKPRHGLACIIDPDRREFVKMVLDLLNDFFGEKLVSVVVFGSVARGDAKPSSDTDVLIVAENLPKRMSEKMEIMAKILIRLRNTQAYKVLRKKCINTWVQFYPLTPEEAKIHRPIYLDMVEDAVILVDKGSFMESVLMSLRRRLDELKARRIYLKNGTWLWDLKPDVKRGEAVEI